MGAFWDLIQAELDKERFDVSDRKVALALKLGSPTTIRNWRNGLKRLPAEKNLRQVADFTGRSYEEVLLIALSETGHARGTRLERPGGVASRIRDELQPPRKPSGKPADERPETDVG